LLHQAALSGNLQVVEKLVNEYKADPTLTNNKGQCAYDVAQTEAIKAFLKKVVRNKFLSQMKFPEDGHKFVKDWLSLFRRFEGQRCQLQASTRRPSIDFVDVTSRPATSAGTKRHGQESCFECTKTNEGAEDEDERPAQKKRMCGNPSADEGPGTMTVKRLGDALEQGSCHHAPLDPSSEFYWKLDQGKTQKWIEHWTFAKPKPQLKTVWQFESVLGAYNIPFKGKIGKALDRTAGAFFLTTKAGQSIDSHIAVVCKNCSTGLRFDMHRDYIWAPQRFKKCVCAYANMFTLNQ
jgi:hypothetical protein